MTSSSSRRSSSEYEFWTSAGRPPSTHSRSPAASTLLAPYASIRPWPEERLEGGDRLGHRRVRVGLVREVEVEPLDAETAEACLRLAQDPLAGEPAIGAGLDRVERLGRDPRPVARRPQPVADPGLAPHAAVRVRRVEPAQPERPRRVHHRERLLAGLPLSEELGRRADAAEVAAAEDDLHRRHRMSERIQPDSKQGGNDHALRATATAVRPRRARAAHRRADDGDPPRQAPPGVRRQREQGARRHRVGRPVRRERADGARADAGGDPHRRPQQRRRPREPLAVLADHEPGRRRRARGRARRRDRRRPSAASTSSRSR